MKELSPLQGKSVLKIQSTLRRARVEEGKSKNDLILELIQKAFETE
jgi:hypothetical protein